jgi:GNAT superfamily N-acetyltransferase
MRRTHIESFCRARAIDQDGIVTIEIAPATADRWDDIAQFFGEAHGELGCWCQYWRQTSSGYRSGGPGSGEANLRLQIEQGPTPGMLAYAEEEMVGWLGLWPREDFQRLVRSRTIPKIDEMPVWSIVCFMIKVGHRRRGVAKALLEGAIRYARQEGIPTLEAYPLDPEGTRVDVNFGYVGFTHMFEQAGFVRVIETNAKSARKTRWLMRLSLA